MLTPVSAPSGEISTRLRGLKILVFCDHFSAQTSGGVERVAEQVCRRLFTWGADLRLLTALPPTMSPFASLPAERTTVARLFDLTRWIPAQFGLAPGALRAAFTLVRDFRPDVLYANGIHFQTSIAAALVQQRTGLPMVTSSHGAAGTLLRQPTRTLHWLYEATAARYILARSTRVVTVSRPSLEHLLELGVDAERIRLVPNGVDLDRFQPPRRRPAGDPQVVYVGRLITYKGPEILLDALLALHAKGVPFNAVFAGEGALRERLERRADGAPVELAGQVVDVPERLRRADVFVLPSLTEGMPLSLLEAMASGCCVIASDIPACRDVITDGRDGLLFPTGEVNALARTLERVLSDGALRRRLGRAAAATAKRLSWDACARATAEVLLEASRTRRT
jgi:glycosyltransferase involved in cell wall biosynthesis